MRCLFAYWRFDQDVATVFAVIAWKFISTIVVTNHFEWKHKKDMYTFCDYDNRMEHVAEILRNRRQGHDISSLVLASFSRNAPASTPGAPLTNMD